jgi:hypothetical protein
MNPRAPRLARSCLHTPDDFDRAAPYFSASSRPQEPPAAVLSTPARRPPPLPRPPPGTRGAAYVDGGPSPKDPGACHRGGSRGAGPRGPDARDFRAWRLTPRPPRPAGHALLAEDGIDRGLEAGAAAAAAAAAGRAHDGRRDTPLTWGPAQRARHAPALTSHPAPPRPPSLLPGRHADARRQPAPGRPGPRVRRRRWRRFRAMQLRLRCRERAPHAAADDRARGRRRRAAVRRPRPRDGERAAQARRGRGRARLPRRRRRSARGAAGGVARLRRKAPRRPQAQPAVRLQPRRAPLDLAPMKRARTRTPRPPKRHRTRPLGPCTPQTPPPLGAPRAPPPKTGPPRCSPASASFAPLGSPSLGSPGPPLPPDLFLTACAPGCGISPLRSSTLVFFMRRRPPRPAAPSLHVPAARARQRRRAGWLAAAPAAPGPNAPP